MSTIASRTLGDAQVFPIGFGAMVLSLLSSHEVEYIEFISLCFIKGLSAFYGDTLPDEERFKLLDAVLESGCNYWDSADIYGDSEDLLGKW